MLTSTFLIELTNILVMNNDIKLNFFVAAINNKFIILTSNNNCNNCNNKINCCANYNWTKLFATTNQNKIILPHDLINIKELQKGQRIALYLPANALNILSMIAYGIPLFTFFIILIITNGKVNEIIQIIITLLAVCASLQIAKIIGDIYLRKNINLKPQL